MNLTNHCRLYEKEAVQQVTGNTIRPGGLSITDRGLEYCNFVPGARLLDIGCGTGATVEYLLSKQFDAVGVDPSPTMLQLAHKRNNKLPLYLAAGEQLPFGDQTMDGVLAECTLSLVQNLPLVLQQISRVLKPQGFLIVSDLYIRNKKDGVLTDLPLDCCLGGAVQQHRWLETITSAGFTKLLWEDHTKCLKELAAQMIFTHGSMEQFWCKILGCEQGRQMKDLLKYYKVGYFLLVAKKK